jgi:hypothetical protein
LLFVWLFVYLSALLCFHPELAGNLSLILCSVCP